MSTPTREQLARFIAALSLYDAITGEMVSNLRARLNLTTHEVEELVRGAEIIADEEPNPDNEFAREVGSYIQRMNYGRVEVLASPRGGRQGAGTHPEWLEWVLICHYFDGGSIEVHAIQRKPGAEVEFHS